MTILTWIYTVSAVVALAMTAWEAWASVKKDLESRKQGVPTRTFSRKDAAILLVLCLTPAVNVIVALGLAVVRCEPLGSRIDEWLDKPLIK